MADVNKQSPIYLARQSAQAEYDAYRLAAQQMHGGQGRNVSHYAAVQVCEGGAFAEMNVWVPVEKIRYEPEGRK